LVSTHATREIAMAEFRADLAEGKY
jgi:hypothetical protein